MNYFRCVAFASCFLSLEAYASISFIVGFLTEVVVHFGNFLLISVRKSGNLFFSINEV